MELCAPVVKDSLTTARAPRAVRKFHMVPGYMKFLSLTTPRKHGKVMARNIINRVPGHTAAYDIGRAASGDFFCRKKDTP